MHHYNISSKFSKNSEASASEFLENIEEMFPRLYKDVFTKLTRLQRFQINIMFIQQQQQQQHSDAVSTAFFCCELSRCGLDL